MHYVLVAPQSFWDSDRMVVGPQTVVTLSYTLTVKNSDGSSEVLETRSAQNPIEFIYGQGLLLPAVEKNIAKQSAGYKKTLVLPPQEAFGDVNPQLEAWYDISKLPKSLPLQPGLKFQTQGPQGDVISVLLKEIRDNKVLLDGNHPLAGATIEFELEILRVRQATSEEITSGQVLSRLH